MDETSRMTALGQYAYLDALPDPAFDRLTQLAADLFHADAATITIVDRAREMVKSRAGVRVEGIEMPGGRLPGARVLASNEMLVVDDLTADPKFADDQLKVGGSRIRFYAEVPLIGVGGIRLGTFALMGHEPRRLSGADRRILAQLGAVATDLLGLTARTLAQSRENRIAAERMGFEAGVRLGFVTQQLPAILWTTDKTLRFTSALGAGLAAIGLDAEQVVGIGLGDFFANDPGGPRNVDAHRAALNGQGTSTDARFGDRVYQCRIDALRNAHGEITGTIGVALDITDRKMMEAKLIQAERLASMGTLAAGVAHEINNPLTYIMANIGFVSERLGKLMPDLSAQPPAAPSEVGKMPRSQLAELTTALAEAQEGTIRVRRIVRDLKILARGDEERYGAVDVRHVIDSSVGMMWNHIRHRAELILELEEVPLVHASESRLGQVILNLLINATQALREGQVAVNQIRIGTHTDQAGRAVITVTDTGAGIPPEVVGRVFDPFFTTKPIGIGTGLGLFICHGIVKALGGEISAESPPGRGATFRVVLPPARDSARPVRAGEENDSPSQRSTSPFVPAQSGRR